MPPVISVQLVSDSSVVRHLAPETQLDFGSCRCDGCRYDLVLPGTPAAVVGCISAGTDHWRLVNYGREDLVVTDLERPHDMITIRAGRLAVIPFELSRVSTAEHPLLTVFGPEPTSPPPPPTGCPALAEHRSQHLLDPTTTYFAVLVALCEPRLRPASSARSTTPPPLPTSAEIAHRLRQRGLSLSARAVDSHIDYLLDKLRLRPPTGAGAARRNWRKETLATAAIQRGLVTPEHLPASTPIRPLVGMTTEGGVGRRPAEVAQYQRDPHRSGRRHAA